MLRSFKPCCCDPSRRRCISPIMAATSGFTLRPMPTLRRRFAVTLTFLVHRAIRSVIRGRSKSAHVSRVPGAKGLRREVIYPYDMAGMLALGEQCSMTERRADDATREVDAWLKCEFLKDRLATLFRRDCGGDELRRFCRVA